MITILEILALVASILSAGYVIWTSMPLIAGRGKRDTTTPITLRKRVTVLLAIVIGLVTAAVLYVATPDRRWIGDILGLALVVFIAHRVSKKRK